MSGTRAEIERGRRAAGELAETEAAFEAVKAAILKTLVAASPAQPEKILKLHLAVQNLEAVRQALAKTVAAGEVAAFAQAAEAAIAEAGLTRG
jgi:uncharacterized membrane protein